MKIKYKILDERVHDVDNYPPNKESYTGNAGMDLRAFFTKPTVPNTDELIIFPDSVVLIPTGLSIYIEDSGVAAVILPRSGLGHKHGIVLGNLVGLMDSSYQGPYMVSCWNRSSEPFTLKLGDRLAQLVFLPIITPTFQLVDDFTTISERGETGFGDSGTH